MFSVITPTYNRSSLIANAIDSLINQTFQDWELIIVDDGSTDETLKIVSSYFSDSRIKYYRQDNKGRSSARNLGIRKAQSDFICFLDSDDYYLPDHLKLIYESLKSHDFKNAFYYGNTFEDVNGTLKKVKEINYHGENCYEFFFLNPIGSPRVCLRREVFNKHLFDQSLSTGEDTELWMRIMPLDIICTKHFSQAYCSHQGRSIFQNTKPILEDLKLKKQLFKKYRNKIKYMVYRNGIGYQYLKLARYYNENSSFKCFIYVLIGLFYSPFNFTKEKLFLIKKSIFS